MVAGVGLPSFVYTICGAIKEVSQDGLYNLLRCAWLKSNKEYIIAFGHNKGRKPHLTKQRRISGRTLLHL